MCWVHLVVERLVAALVVDERLVAALVVVLLLVVNIVICLVQCSWLQVAALEGQRCVCVTSPLNVVSCLVRPSFCLVYSSYKVLSAFLELMVLELLSSCRSRCAGCGNSCNSSRRRSWWRS